MSAFLKNWLGGRYLSVWGPRSPLPLLHTVWIHALFTQGRGGGGGGGVDEPVRRLEGRFFTRGIENTNMTDCTVSPVYRYLTTRRHLGFGIFIDIWSIVLDLQAISKCTSEERILYSFTQLEQNKLGAPSLFRQYQGKWWYAEQAKNGTFWLICRMISCWW